MTTEFDQREELHAALGHKMMGCSLPAKTSLSNSEEPGRHRAPPPIYVDDATGAQVTEDWWPGMPHDA